MYIDNGYRNKDLTWRGNQLYCRNKITGFSLVQDLTYPHMFWVSWPEGDLSESFYNYPWAKQNAGDAVLYALNSDVGFILDTSR